MKISLWDPMATPDVIITRTGAVRRRTDTPLDEAKVMVDGLQRDPTPEQWLIVYEMAKQASNVSFADNASGLKRLVKLMQALESRKRKLR